jgi:hypothetical protein
MKNFVFNNNKYGICIGIEYRLDIRFEVKCYYYNGKKHRKGYYNNSNCKISIKCNYKNGENHGQHILYVYK